MKKKLGIFQKKKKKKKIRKKEATLKKKLPSRITLRGKKFLITKCSELISHQLSQHLWINENQVEYLKRFAFDQLVEICKSNNYFSYLIYDFLTFDH